MRVSIFVIAISLLFVSCSSSRTVDAELIIEPGNHINRSVMGSDILVRKGSVLDVSFSSGNRFYVGSGGALTGFQSGAHDTRIYAEKGARLPEEKYLTKAEVITVSNVRRSFQDRFKELPPLRIGSSEAGQNPSRDDDDDERHHRDRRSKADSVKPASYKSKD